jgi:hypothetical protein
MDVLLLLITCFRASIDPDYLTHIDKMHKKQIWIKRLFFMDENELDAIIRLWTHRAKTIPVYAEPWIRLSEHMLKQPDRIYKLYVILCYIHNDPAIKEWMLQEENNWWLERKKAQPHLKDEDRPHATRTFISMLAPRIGLFMTGHRYNGQPYQQDDDRSERHLGWFVMLMAQIASSL